MKTSVVVFSIFFLFTLFPLDSHGGADDATLFRCQISNIVNPPRFVFDKAEPLVLSPNVSQSIPLIFNDPAGQWHRRDVYLRARIKKEHNKVLIGVKLLEDLETDYQDTVGTRAPFRSTRLAPLSGVLSCDELHQPYAFVNYVSAAPLRTEPFTIRNFDLTKVLHQTTHPLTLEDILPSTCISGDVQAAYRDLMASSALPGKETLRLWAGGLAYVRNSWECTETDVNDTCQKSRQVQIRVAIPNCKSLSQELLN